tara:strand:+ start:127 stop:651 length:525 start_codon:yes stop_codon:yes gene_type:complete
MKQRLLSTIFIIFLSLSVQSQNYIYKGDNQYKATDSWAFKLNATYWTGNPEFTIAKNENGTGYLMIAINVPFKSHHVNGTTLIFLNNGSTIKCFDKGVRDHLNKQSLVIYNLTKEEIESLKSSRISSIRFSIKGGIEGEQSFTADNKKPMLRLIGSKEKDYYETDVEISKLFNE